MDRSGLKKRFFTALLLCALALTVLPPRAGANSQLPAAFKTTKIIGYTSYILTNDRIFVPEKALLTAEGEADLAKVAGLLQSCARHPVVVRVHSDNLGFSSYNDKLSLERANLIKSRLAEKVAFVPDALSAEGLGARHPVAANLVNGKDNPEGRKHNRRTEIVVNTNETLQTPVAEVVEETKEKVAEKKEELTPEERRKLPPELQAMHQELLENGEKNSSEAQADIDVMKTEAEDRAFGAEGGFGQDSNAVVGESKKDMTPDGKRKMHELTDAEKKKLQEEQEWNRNEFGLFLKNEQ